MYVLMILVCFIFDGLWHLFLLIPTLRAESLRKTDPLCTNCHVHSMMSTTFEGSAGSVFPNLQHANHQKPLKCIH